MYFKHPFDYLLFWLESKLTLYLIAPSFLAPYIEGISIIFPTFQIEG